MRIIGGQARGRRITIPSGSPVRPTSDRIKEALFNLLFNVSECRFLDLFAGSGSVGLEALSRGAAHVVFVEKESRCIESIKANALRCGFTGGYECIASTADGALKRLGLRGETFDIIFMDPPYERGLVQKALKDIGQNAILREQGRIAVQHSARESAEREIEHLVLEDNRRYGDTLLSFWRLSK